MPAPARRSNCGGLYRKPITPSQIVERYLAETKARTTLISGIPSGSRPAYMDWIIRNSADITRPQKRETRRNIYPESQREIGFHPTVIWLMSNFDGSLPDTGAPVRGTQGDIGGFLKRFACGAPRGDAGRAIYFYRGSLVRKPTSAAVSAIENEVINRIRERVKVFERDSGHAGVTRTTLELLPMVATWDGRQKQLLLRAD